MIGKRLGPGSVRSVSQESTEDIPESCHREDRDLSHSRNTPVHPSIYSLKKRFLLDVKLPKYLKDLVTPKCELVRSFTGPLERLCV